MTWWEKDTLVDENDQPGPVRRAAGKAAQWLGESAADAALAGASVAQILDPAVAAAGALGSYVVPRTAPEGASLGERFTNEMEGLRSRRAEGARRSPNASLAGMLAGGAAAAPALAGGAVLSKLAPAAEGVLPLLARAGAGIGDAALMNAASQASSNIDQDPGAAALQAATSPWNAVGAAPALASAAAPALTNGLEAIGINRGRRVLLNGADSLSNRRPLADASVREAIESGGIVPFGTTKGAAKRLDQIAERQGAEYGRIVAELEARGVKGPDATRLADRIVASAAESEPGTMIDAVPAAYLDEAVRVSGKAGKDSRLGLTQSESLKRSLQTKAKYGKLEETPLNEARRDIARIFREANEEEIASSGALDRMTGGDAGIADLAERFVPVKQRLGRLMDASEAADRGAARVSQRGAFDLTENALAGAGAATMNPVLPAAALGKNLLRTRGTSALAVGSLKLGDQLRALTTPGGQRSALSVGEALALRLSPEFKPQLPAYMAGDPLVEETEGERFATAVRNRKASR